jgi:putative NIF3 family GTP cyclohydrolase 1 type 2
MLKEACVDKLGCFLVGEIDLAVYNAAKEYGMNLLVAGHYATETLGDKALMRSLTIPLALKPFCLRSERVRLVAEANVEK